MGTEQKYRVRGFRPRALMGHRHPSLCCTETVQPSPTHNRYSQSYTTITVRDRYKQPLHNRYQMLHNGYVPNRAIPIGRSEATAVYWSESRSRSYFPCTVATVHVSHIWVSRQPYHVQCLGPVRLRLALVGPPARSYWMRLSTHAFLCVLCVTVYLGGGTMIAPSLTQGFRACVC